MVTDQDVIVIMAEAIFDARCIYGRALGLDTGPRWADATADQRSLALAMAMTTASAGVISFEDSHNLELGRLSGQGWTLGPEYDLEAKTSPFLVPYDRLPVTTKAGFLIYETLLGAIMRHYGAH